jgi:hypothetical protein
MKNLIFTHELKRLWHLPKMIRVHDEPVLPHSNLVKAYFIVGIAMLYNKY